VTDAAPPTDPAPRPRRLRVGWWVRAVLLLSWLGFYGYHASDHLLLSLGLLERQDSRSVILSHLDHRYRYAFRDAQGREVGHLFLEYTFIDAHYEVDMLVTFDRSDFIPGMSLLRSRFGDQLSSDRITIEVTNRLDDRFVMRELEIDGNVFGITGRFRGEMRPEGLVGEYRIGSRSDRITLDSFDQEASAGFDLMIALPPGLEEGDRFRDQVIAIDWKPPFLKRQPVVYEVVGTRTDPDGLDLHRITLSQNGRKIGEMLADPQGIIRETRHPSTGLTLELTTIFEQGVKVWPPAAEPADQR